MGNPLAEAGESASSEVRRLLTERYAAHERDAAVPSDGIAATAPVATHLPA